MKFVQTDSITSVYFDSSLVLSILLNESISLEAAKIWSENRLRISSVLLEAECYIGLRRQNTKKNNTSKTSIEKNLLFIADRLETVTLTAFDSKILPIIRAEKLLAACRSLDAIHIATAIYLRDNTGEEIKIASFDSRLRETAIKLNFDVLPTTL